MEKILILDSERKLENEDLEIFEKNYNLTLPKNYKNFILKFNGGYIDEHKYIDTINSIKYDSHNNLVEDAIESYQIIEKLIPTGYLPIAKHHSGNEITLLSSNNTDNGKIIIFYFDRDQEPEVIANSLEELLGVNSIDEL